MLVRRDPFARTELHKERVYTDTDDCDWCGWQFHKSRGGKRYLYRYETQTDGGTVHGHKGLFCSKSCHDDYHKR